MDEEEAEPRAKGARRSSLLDGASALAGIIAAVPIVAGWLRPFDSIRERAAGVGMLAIFGLVGLALQRARRRKPLFNRATTIAFVVLWTVLVAAVTLALGPHDRSDEAASAEGEQAGQGDGPAVTTTTVDDTTTEPDAATTSTSSPSSTTTDPDATTSTSTSSGGAGDEQFPVAYPAQQLTITRGTCGSSGVVDLDEPETSADYSHAEFEYSDCAQTPATFRLVPDVKMAVASSADDAASCKDAVRRSGVTGNVRHLPKDGEVLCFETRLAEAESYGHPQRIVLLKVLQVVADESARVEVTAWDEAPG
jgi:hypothetical protein